MAICHRLIATGRQFKRPKDTGVSPGTVQAQPPCKQRFGASEQLFSNGMTLYYITHTHDEYIQQ